MPFSLLPLDLTSTTSLRLDQGPIGLGTDSSAMDGCSQMRKALAPTNSWSDLSSCASGGQW